MKTSSKLMTDFTTTLINSGVAAGSLNSLVSYLVRLERKLKFLIIRQFWIEIVIFLQKPFSFISETSPMKNSQDSLKFEKSETSPPIDIITGVESK